MSWLAMYRMFTVYWNVIWESFCCVKYTLYLKFLWNIYPTQFSDDEGTPPNLKCSSATTNEKKKKNDQYKRIFPEWLQMRDFQIYNSSHSVSPPVFLCWTFDVGIEPHCCQGKLLVSWFPNTLTSVLHPDPFCIIHYWVHIIPPISCDLFF